jgi:hypothetical protein
MTAANGSSVVADVLGGLLSIWAQTLGSTRSPDPLGGGATALIGSVKVKVEPRPTSLRTQILPPWSSTNFRERASPSPVPSAHFSAAPTCRNSSNTVS